MWAKTDLACFHEVGRVKTGEGDGGGGDEGDGEGDDANVAADVDVADVTDTIDTTHKATMIAMDLVTVTKIRATLMAMMVATPMVAAVVAFIAPFRITVAAMVTVAALLLLLPLLLLTMVAYSGDGGDGRGGEGDGDSEGNGDIIGLKMHRRRHITLTICHRGQRHRRRRHCLRHHSLFCSRSR